MLSTTEGNKLPMSESMMVNSLTEYLVLQGYHVRSEVSNMGQSIDLVATNNRMVTAIEVKRYNWRRALKQCRAHTLVADYIVIAIAQKTIPIELSSELILNGWGLVVIDHQTGEWTWQIKPKRNKKIWEPQREHFTKSMLEVGYVS